MTGRRASLVLCTRDGDLRGALPPYDVDSPWWPEVAPVVDGARKRYGIENWAHPGGPSSRTSAGPSDPRGRRTAGRRTEWSAAWRHAVPGCDLDRASVLLAPVTALRLAVIYRGFLDRIEPDERIYHAADR